MKPTDDIGLTDFLVLVYRFLKRNLILISAITLTGLIVGFFYSNQKSDYFSSELIGFSNVIDKTTLLEVLSPLTTLTDEKNYEELSSKLGLSLDEATQIRLLNFTDSRHIKTSHAPSATDKALGNLIVINTQVYDQSILPNLEKGISKYLNDNPYVKSHENMELQKTQNLITEISKNIALIDSLNNQPNQSNSTVSIQREINPLNYKEALLVVENLKVDIQTLKAFTVISSFYKVNKPSNKSLLIIISATIGFFILGLFVVFIKELAELAQE